MMGNISLYNKLNSFTENKKALLMRHQSSLAVEMAETTFFSYRRTVLLNVSFLKVGCDFSYEASGRSFVKLDHLLCAGIY